MKSSNNKSGSVPDEYFAYSDSYRTKDLIWDAYFGFSQQYDIFVMYRSMNRSGKVSSKAMIRYASGFFREIKDFLDKIYPDSKEPTNAADKARIRELFSTVCIKLDDDDILFLSNFFGKFMVDSGIKNVIYLKDNSKPGDRFMNDRYPDIK